MKPGRATIRGRFKPAIWVIAAAGFLNATAFSITLPFLSLYLVQERGLSMTLVGVILLLSGLASAVAQMYSGALSDHFGRRPLLLGTVAASLLLYAAMAVLIGVSAPVSAIAAIFAAVRSVLVMMRPVISAVVADLSPKERLTETYGLLRIGQNVGWAAGPALGGFLAIRLSYAWLFGLGCLVVMGSLALIYFRLRGPLGQAVERVDFRGMLSIGADRRFLEFTGLSLLVFMVMGQMASTLSVFTVDLVGFSTAQYGLLLTINGLIVVFFQYPMTRLLNGLGQCMVLAAGSLLYGLGYLSMGWASAYPLAVAGMVVITSGEMAFAPTSLAVVGQLSSPAWRGRYMGFYGLAETLGFSVGPLLGGVLLDVFPLQPILLWGTISVVAFVAAAGFLRQGRTDSSQTPST